MLLLLATTLTFQVLSASTVIPLKIVNNSGEDKKMVPLIIPVSQLSLSNGSVFNSVKLLSVDKRSYPCQFDQLNISGKKLPFNEISILVDLKSGENLYELILSENSQKKAVLQASTEKRYYYITNNLVKVLLSKTKIHNRKLNFKTPDAWITLTGSGGYHSDPKLDNQWREWSWGKAELSLIADGPVRKIMRETIERTNKENDKKVKLIHDWSVFSGRKEILSVINIVNVGKSQLVQISRMVKGFYDITPGGKGSPSQDRFAGLNKKDELVTGLLKDSRYFLKKPKLNDACWYDAFYIGEKKPAVGLGCVVEYSSGLYAIVLANIENKGKSKLRMTESYEPKNAVIWPDKSYIYKQWYVLHQGDFKTTQNFCKLINNIKIEVLTKP